MWSQESGSWILAHTHHVVLLIGCESHKERGLPLHSQCQNNAWHTMVPSDYLLDEWMVKWHFYCSIALKATLRGPYFCIIGKQWDKWKDHGLWCQKRRGHNPHSVSHTYSVTWTCDLNKFIQLLWALVASAFKCREQWTLWNYALQWTLNVDKHWDPEQASSKYQFSAALEGLRKAKWSSIFFLLSKLLFFQNDYTRVRVWEKQRGPGDRKISLFPSTAIKTGTTSVKSAVYFFCFSDKAVLTSLFSPSVTLLN